MFTANNSGLRIKYKLPEAQVCNKGKCYNNSFILTKDITEEVILGTPFLTQIYPFTVNSRGIISRGNLFEFITPIKTKELKSIQESEEEFINLLNQKNSQIKLLQKEIKYEKIEQQIKTYSSEILKIEKEFLKEVCAEVPTAFWERNSFEVGLPYEEGFEERNIPTKAKPVQMNKEILEHCKKEIQGFLDKKLISQRNPFRNPIYMFQFLS